MKTTDSYLMFQASQLAQKPKRLKIADYIGVALLFGYCAYVLVFANYYRGGYLTYDEASNNCVFGMVCFGIFACIAQYFPYPVRVEENDINQAIEVLLSNEETALKEKIIEAGEDVLYAEDNFKSEEKKFLLAKEALEKFFDEKLK